MNVAWARLPLFLGASWVLRSPAPRRWLSGPCSGSSRRNGSSQPAKSKVLEHSAVSAKCSRREAVLLHECRLARIMLWAPYCRQDELFDMWRTEVKEARDELHEQSPECNISRRNSRIPADPSAVPRSPSHLGPGFGPASATSSQSRSCLLCSMQVGTRDVRDQPFLRIPGKDLAEARENQLHQARKPTAVQEVKA